MLEAQITALQEEIARERHEYRRKLLERKQEEKQGRGVFDSLNLRASQGYRF